VLIGDSLSCHAFGPAPDGFLAQLCQQALKNDSIIRIVLVTVFEIRKERRLGRLSALNGEAAESQDVENVDPHGILGVGGFDPESLSQPHQEYHNHAGATTRLAVNSLRGIASRLTSGFNAHLPLRLAWYEAVSILLILCGEALIFADYRVLGVGVQALNIIAVAVVVVALHAERVQLVEALALLSVFRVVNLSFALVPTVTIYWIATVYGVMYVPLIAVIVSEKMSRYDLGIDNVRRSVVLLPLGVVVGTGFAVIEYRILANTPLIPNASASELIQLSIVMIFFVALVEALLFLVLLQPQLIERSNAVAGILITSVIFGAMHAGFANVYELLFATAAGIVLGGAFYKTRDLALVVTILAVNNIVLFGLLGFLTS
jgi:membrane protease YdiL (CAAX protease family)